MVLLNTHNNELNDSFIIPNQHLSFWSFFNYLFCFTLLKFTRKSGVGSLKTLQIHIFKRIFQCPVIGFVPFTYKHDGWNWALHHCDVQLPGPPGEPTTLQSLSDRTWAVVSLRTGLYFSAERMYLWLRAAPGCCASWSMRQSNLHQNIDGSNNCTPAQNQNSCLSFLPNTFRPIVLTHVWIASSLCEHASGWWKQWDIEERRKH